MGGKMTLDTLDNNYKKNKRKLSNYRKIRKKEVFKGKLNDELINKFYYPMISTGSD